MTVEKLKDAIVDKNYSDEKIEKILPDVRFASQKEMREVVNLLTGHRPKVIPNLWVKSFKSFVPR